MEELRVREEEKTRGGESADQSRIINQWIDAMLYNSQRMNKRRMEVEELKKEL